MDAVLDKRDTIVSKYSELANSDNPTREEVVDLRQEINRCDHLIRHHLRAQFNYAGRLLGMGAFAAAGLVFTLKSTPLSQKLTIKRTLVNFGIIAAFAGVGYFYGSTFHSKGREASQAREKAELRVEKVHHILADAEKQIQEKLSKPKI